CIVLHQFVEFVRDPRADVVGPWSRPDGTFACEHQRRFEADALLRLAIGFDREIDARPADPDRLQSEFQNVAMPAGRVEIDVDGNGGHGRGPVQRLERNADALCEPLLHHRIDHLEIAGIEDDAGRIAMLEIDLLPDRETAAHNTVLTYHSSGNSSTSSMRLR